MLARKAWHGKVLVEGVHLESLKGCVVVLRPLPRAAKAVMEALGAGGQGGHWVLAAVGELDVKAKPEGGGERKQAELGTACEVGPRIQLQFMLGQRAGMRCLFGMRK